MRLPNFDNANCKDVDQRFFFPESQAEEMKNRPYIKLMCSECPIFNNCLEYSLTVMVEGIWAGNNKQERSAIRRARGIKAKPLELSIGGVFTSYTPNAIKQRKRRDRLEKQQ